MSIAQNKVVSIHYKLVDAASGQLLESSESRPPMAYLHGAKNLIPGLEKALEGKQVGDKLEVTIPPEDAYGERDESGVQQVPAEAFKEMDKVEVGMVVTTQTEQGPANLMITQVGEEVVTVDANHPLAGKSLTFNVSVEAIRDATEEEQAHGHAHGPEGHQH